MSCPVKQNNVEHLALTTRITSTLTSRNFPVRVTSAIAAYQTRQQSVGDLQGSKYPSSFRVRWSPELCNVW